jgi:UPF0271 protein
MVPPLKDNTPMSATQLFTSQGFANISRTRINQTDPNIMTSLDRIEINVDCGEAFGLWECGPDEDLMPMIDAANVACGGHAGDPVVMRRTVAACKKYGVKVGARESRSTRPFAR